MTGTQRELSALREEIDRIDEDIGDLIAERLEVAESVAEAKASEGLDLVDEGREEAVKSHHAERFAACGLPEERGRELATFLIDVSLEREEAIDGES
jgi:chorismate mutase